MASLMRRGAAPQTDAARLSISVIFSVNGANLADVKLSPTTTVHELGTWVAKAAFRSRKAAFPLVPRLTDQVGQELDPQGTLAQVGLQDGAQLTADMFPVVVTASEDATARIWNAESAMCEKILEGHQGPLCHAVFSPDSKYIATASEDCTARIWLSVTGECWRTLRGHKDVVNTVAFSPCGDFIVSASNDKTAKVWSSRNGRCLLTLEGHDQPVFEASYSLDGEHIITNSLEGCAKVWEARTGTLLRTLHNSKVSMYQTSCAPDGNFLAIAPGDATAQILDMDSSRCVAELLGHSGTVVSALFAPPCREMRINSPRSQEGSPKATSTLGDALSVTEFTQAQEAEAVE